MAEREKKETKTKKEKKTRWAISSIGLLRLHLPSLCLPLLPSFYFTFVSGSPCSAGVKSCAAGAGEANRRNGDSEVVVVAGRAANERVKEEEAAAAAAVDDAEGSRLFSTANAAPRLDAAARARRSMMRLLSVLERERARNGRDGREKERREALLFSPLKPFFVCVPFSLLDLDRYFFQSIDSAIETL